MSLWDKPLRSNPLVEEDLSFSEAATTMPRKRKAKDEGDDLERYNKTYDKCRNVDVSSDDRHIDAFLHDTDPLDEIAEEDLLPSLSDPLGKVNKTIRNKVMSILYIYNNKYNYKMFPLLIETKS